MSLSLLSLMRSLGKRRRGRSVFMDFLSLLYACLTFRLSVCPPPNAHFHVPHYYTVLRFLRVPPIARSVKVNSYFFSSSSFTERAVNSRLTTQIQSHRYRCTCSCVVCCLLRDVGSRKQERHRNYSELHWTTVLLTKNNRTSNPPHSQKLCSLCSQLSVSVD